MLRRLCTALLFVPLTALAAEYECPAFRKVDAEQVYSSDQLKKSSFSTRLEETSAGAFVSRCSFSPSAGKITCDRYEVDHVEVDPVIKVKKFYVYRAQFDFQVFKDLSSVENNGRGGIQYGRCKLVSP